MKWKEYLPGYSYVNPSLPFRRGRRADAVNAFGHANVDVALLHLVREAVRVVGVDHLENAVVERGNALRVGAVAAGDDDGCKAAVVAAGYVLRPARC